MYEKVQPSIFISYGVYIRFLCFKLSISDLGNYRSGKIALCWNVTLEGRLEGVGGILNSTQESIFIYMYTII